MNNVLTRQAHTSYQLWKPWIRNCFKPTIKTATKRYEFSLVVLNPHGSTTMSVFEAGFLCCVTMRCRSALINSTNITSKTLETAYRPQFFPCYLVHWLYHYIYFKLKNLRFRKRRAQRTPLSLCRVLCSHNIQFDKNLFIPVYYVWRRHTGTDTKSYQCHHKVSYHYYIQCRFTLKQCPGKTLLAGARCPLSVPSKNARATTIHTCMVV